MTFRQLLEHCQQEIGKLLDKIEEFNPEAGDEEDILDNLHVELDYTLSILDEAL